MSTMDRSHPVGMEYVEGIQWTETVRATYFPHRPKDWTKGEPVIEDMTYIEGTCERKPKDFTKDPGATVDHPEYLDYLCAVRKAIDAAPGTVTAVNVTTATWRWLAHHHEVNGRSFPGRICGVSCVIDDNVKEPFRLAWRMAVAPDLTGEDE